MTHHSLQQGGPTAPSSTRVQRSGESLYARVIPNLLAALTTSVVSLSLGAALGMLSGRGAGAGMLSAAIFPIIACTFGGTRVKASGPTAPMSAFMATITALVMSDPSLTDAFVSTVLYQTALVLIIAGLMGLGRFIELVPRVVVSGFMTGIGFLVWTSQLETLSNPATGMPLWREAGLAALTVSLIFLSPRVIRRVPGTLTAMIVVSAFVHLVPSWFAGISLVGELTVTIPRLAVPDLSTGALLTAFPYALGLAFLCYLDTLLTSLVIDIVTKEKTQRDKELWAQGLATFGVALIGGIPGAQAMVRSYVLIKEGATERCAGILMGVFVLLQVYVLSDLIAFMPTALFTGILVKVGYDVIDWEPLRIYLRQCWSRTHAEEKTRSIPGVVEAARSQGMYVGHLEALLIVSTTIITVLVDLNVAVFLFTALFFLARLGNIILDMRTYDLVTSDLIAIATLREPVTFERMRSLHTDLETSHRARVAVFDMGRVTEIDETGILALKATVAWLRQRGTTPLFSGIASSLKPAMGDMGLLKDIGYLNVFRTVDRALMYADHLLERVRLEDTGLDSYLPRELVVFDAPVETKDELLRFIAEHAFNEGYALQGTSFYHDLLVSEQRGSTGLIKGVALPHCRSTVVLETFVMYVRIAHALTDYASLDGTPINHVVFIGGTEEMNTYLKVMAKVARVINDPETFAKLNAAADADAAYHALVDGDLAVFAHAPDDAT